MPTRAELLELYEDAKDEMTPDEMAEFTALLTTPAYAELADDPVAFGLEVMGEHYTDDVKNLMLSIRDNPVVLARSANATGKTFSLASIAWWWFHTHKEAQVHILAAPPLENLETKLWAELMQKAALHPQLVQGCRVKHLFVSRGPLDFIRGIPIPKDSTPAQIEASVAGSHRGAILYLVDEGDAVPTAVFNAIESCLSGGEGGVVVAFNPRDEIGETYAMEVEGRAVVVEMSALRHPNVVTGLDKVPGAVSRDKTIRRINEWTKPVEPGEENKGDVFQVPDFLVGETCLSSAGKELPPLPATPRRTVDRRFSYMVLGKYDSRGSEKHVFDRTYLGGLYEKYSGTQPIRSIIAGEDLPGYGPLTIRFEIYEEPQPGLHYAVGGDVARGMTRDFQRQSDRDFCVTDVVCRENGKHVASGWGNLDTSPELFAGDLDKIGRYFAFRPHKGNFAWNEMTEDEAKELALLIVENNTYGTGTLAELARLRYRNLYSRKSTPSSKYGKPVEEIERGFRTTPTTKPLAVGYMKDLLLEAAKGGDGLYLRGPRAIRECMNYGYVARGDGNSNTCALAGHDDHVSSLYLCGVVLVERPLRRTERPVKEPDTPRNPHLPRVERVKFKEPASVWQPL